MMRNKYKYLVFGLGASGESAVRVLVNQECSVEVYGNSSSKEFPGVPFYDQAAVNITDIDFDTLVKSPGISNNHDVIKYCAEKNIPVINEIELTSYFNQTPIIAVTGSNGKSTTVTMIADYLKSVGKRVFLGGNIGHAFGNIVLEGEYDVAVIELSSFQCEQLDHFKADYSALLNLSPTHMERYEDLDDYSKAKEKLITKTKNKCLVDESFFPNESINQLKNNFYLTFDFKDSVVKGDHNKENFFYCYELCRSFLQSSELKDFQNFINSFKGIEHRLEYVREINGLKVYNDSKSTNLKSTLCAVDSFQGPVDLILGGKLRSSEVNFSSELLKRKEVIRKIYVMGESSDLLMADLSGFDLIKINDLGELKSKLIHEIGTLILSPGFPSFDQYKNFEHRGRLFKEMISYF